MKLLQQQSHFNLLIIEKLILIKIQIFDGWSCREKQSNKFLTLFHFIKLNSEFDF